MSYSSRINNTRSGRYLTQFLVAGFSLIFVSLLSFSVQANQILPNAGQSVRVVSGIDPTSDFLYVSPPNGKGVSINRFSSFSVSDRLLKIVNPGSQANSQLPATIVIISNSVSITNTVESFGAAADILFLSESPNGQLTCSNCSLENFYRIGFVVNSGPTGLQAGSLSIGKLNSAVNGLVSLSNVFALGALSLDVLSGKVKTANKIDVTTKVKKRSSGGYEASPNGKYVSAAGSINIRQGRVFWDYETGKTLGYELTSSGADIAGTLSAAAAHVWMTSPANFSADIDTENDLLSTVRYRGQVRLNNEEVSLSSLNAADFDLSKNVSILSSGRVLLQSIGDLNSTATIQAEEVSLISGESLFHNGNLFAYQLNAEAKNIVNVGLLTVDGVASLAAINRLVNRSGGSVVANVLRLETDLNQDVSYILNGSRTPFQSYDNIMLPYYSSYFADLDRTKLGAFYQADVEDRFSLSGLQMADKTSAHLQAKKIYVRTKAFENINPYYKNAVSKNDQTVYEFDRDHMEQVSISAQDLLEIEAANYIVNATAKMGTESPASIFRLKADLVVNERYRVYFGLNNTKGTSHSTSTDGYNGQITTTTDSIKLSLLSYSPPGRMYAMGNFESETSSAFLNSIGYLEIFGDAKFKTPRLIDRGVATQEINHVEVYADYPDELCGGNSTCASTSHSENITPPDQMDSLFYINGNAVASAANSGLINNVRDVNPSGLGVTDHADYSPMGEYAKKMASELYRFYDGMAPTNSGIIQGAIAHNFENPYFSVTTTGVSVSARDDLSLEDEDFTVS